MTDAVNPDLLTGLARVFASNAQRRAERAGVALSILSRHERRIVREAAVMGYVLGERAGAVKAHRGGAADGRDFPADAAIVRQVIEHCDSTSDLYPYLAAACDGRRRRVTKARMWPGEAADQ